MTVWVCLFPTASKNSFGDWCCSGDGVGARTRQLRNKTVLSMTAGAGNLDRRGGLIMYRPEHSCQCLARKKTLDNQSLTCRSKIVSGRYAAHPYRARPSKLSIARLARVGFGCNLRSIRMFRSTSIGLLRPAAAFPKSHHEPLSQKQVRSPAFDVIAAILSKHFRIPRTP
jgi:hypothetical protein